MNTYLLSEPNLYFRGGKKCVDSKVGLLNYGPNSLTHENQIIEVGIIGSRQSIRETKAFFKRLEEDIPGKYYENSYVRSVDFPGVDQNKPLGFFFNINDEHCEIIPQSVIDNLISEQFSRKEKILFIARAFRDAMTDLAGIRPGPNIVVLAYPQEVIKYCSNPGTITKKISLVDRTYPSLKRLAETDSNDRDSLYDLHNHLKVIGFELNLKTQILYPNTRNFATEQDEAIVAWNIVSAIFYKSTGNPWKLADLEPETIHVGISFFNDINANDQVVTRAAIAQVYMKTGDSQVIRGMEIPLLNEEHDRIPQLTSNQAENILSKALDVYKRQHNSESPYRIVVHKTSEYSYDELEGFKRSADGVAIQDYLHIMKRSGLRVISPSKYPVARGTVFDYQDLKEFYIFTTGYVSALDTYPGSEVPRPLRVKTVDITSNSKIIATDIMNLTKLDWNSCEFAKAYPVTISTSEKVGAILAEITLTGRNINPPITYADYM